jgi:hypothetical protein
MAIMPLDHEHTLDYSKHTHTQKKTSIKKKKEDQSGTQKKKERKIHLVVSGMGKQCKHNCEYLSKTNFEESKCSDPAK